MSAEKYLAVSLEGHFLLGYYQKLLSATQIPQLVRYHTVIYSLTDENWKIESFSSIGKKIV
ncbi:hypothetical protein P5673_016769 [Acropora cervicornis]|uniref:Uncharacterized protein n=1 Tax=Acropora cervicornis TaxID=6130 RepID=A0AAD9QGF4_ACRCE|nr:hypothetical protein P5673_016769 [Acropora cervicornis]